MGSKYQKKTLNSILKRLYWSQPQRHVHTSGSEYKFNGVTVQPLMALLLFSSHKQAAFLKTTSQKDIELVSSPAILFPKWNYYFFGYFDNKNK